MASSGDHQLRTDSLDNIDEGVPVAKRLKLWQCGTSSSQFRLGERRTLILVQLAINTTGCSIVLSNRM